MADFTPIPINGTAEQLERLLGMEIATEIGENSTDDQLATAKAVHEASKNSAGSVKYDAVQELTEEQKAQARNNIGAMEEPEYAGVVNFKHSSMKDVGGIELAHINSKGEQIGGVRISSDEDYEHEELGYKVGVLELSGGVDEDFEAIIRRVASGVHDNDAATVGQLKSVDITTPQSFTEEQKAQARANIGIYGQAVVTDEKYFDITADGVLSLKEEYRKDGSKNAELPAEIAIPEIVNDILVTELAVEMFRSNLAVRKITIPYAVTEIPDKFCLYASNLVEINGTQNVTSVGKSAFAVTSIKKALFPNLTSLGETAFYRCVYLAVADIGNNITALPKSAFNSCERLTTLIGGASITSIGDSVFWWTSRLKTLSFAPNVRSIGDNGLYMSRVNYDWKKHGEETGCTFGERATYAQLNPTDFWTGKSYRICENPINSTFNQNNNNYDPEYNSRCNACTAATIYSALANVKLDDPTEFEKKYEKAVKEKYTGTQADIAYADGVVNFLREAGFVVNETKPSNEPWNWYSISDDLQLLYDSLADGCLVGLEVNDGSGGNSHILTAYGINKDGEIMVVNSSSVSSNLKQYFPDDDKAIFYAQPIQNITVWKVGENWGSFMVVKRPENWGG